MRVTRLRPVPAALTAAAALVLALIFPPPAHAQEQETVRVLVTDAGTGAPLSGAEVWLGRGRTVTDSLGAARLPRAPRAQLTVRRLGYAPFASRTPFGDGYETEVQLAAVPVRVAGVSGAARSEPRPVPHSGPLRRFYERMERGRGAFITRDQIDKRKPRRLVDAFREVPGVRVIPTNRGDILHFTGAVPFMYTTLDARAGECPVQYYLDGSSWEPDQPGVISNDVRPDEVEGIEVYRRLSEVPAEFRRPGAECGVVLIWLKER